MRISDWSSDVCSSDLKPSVHPELLSGDELKAFVNAYIIPNRYVFSDGTYEGQLPDKNGDMVQVAGEWGSFSITGASGNTVMPSEANIQGCNGVIHRIADVDRKSVVKGKSVSVRVDYGGRGIIKEKQ